MTSDSESVHILDTRSQDSSPGPSSSPCRTPSLKFGMDRILSEDVAPARRLSPTWLTTPRPPSVAEESTVPRCLEKIPPCSECVSSLLRCCRLAGEPTHYVRQFYPAVSLLHSPRPIRPYTNLITESSVTERSPLASSNTAKRKRSWSRAVFSNLQRKGLEKRFQIQKYITKPDRRQLAATLGLTDAQVKVWFQNRRMKWRHSKELKFQSGNYTSSEPRSEPYSSSSSTFSNIVIDHNN